MFPTAKKIKCMSIVLQSENTYPVLLFLFHLSMSLELHWGHPTEFRNTWQKCCTFKDPVCSAISYPFSSGDYFSRLAASSIRSRSGKRIKSSPYKRKVWALKWQIETYRWLATNPREKGSGRLVRIIRTELSNSFSFANASLIRKRIDYEDFYFYYKYIHKHNYIHNLQRSI